jgi:hypothetical protein
VLAFAFACARLCGCRGLAIAAARSHPLAIASAAADG